MTLTRRAVLLGGTAALLPLTAAATAATLYKTPGCECCDGYARELRRAGIAVEVVETEEMPAVKARAGVPAELEGCHTTLIGRYAVEGHVPISAVRKLLAERPADIAGISLPGMPMGSPGMSGPKDAPFVTFSFDRSGKTARFAVE